MIKQRSIKDLRAIPGTILTVSVLLLAILWACTREKSSEPKRDKLTHFHVFTYDLDDRRDLVNFNMWVVTSFPADTTTVKPEHNSEPLDSSGINVIMRYPYQDHEYVVYTASTDRDDQADATFIGEAVNGRIVSSDTVLKIPIPSTSGPVKIMKDVYALDFAERRMHGDSLKLRSEGSIYIKRDTLVVGYRFFSEPR